MSILSVLSIHIARSLILCTWIILRTIRLYLVISHSTIHCWIVNLIIYSLIWYVFYAFSCLLYHTINKLELELPYGSKKIERKIPVSTLERCVTEDMRWECENGVSCKLGRAGAVQLSPRWVEEKKRPWGDRMERLKRERDFNVNATRHFPSHYFSSYMNSVDRGNTSCIIALSSRLTQPRERRTKSV